jgi:hypothetical protein
MLFTQSGTDKVIGSSEGWKINGASEPPSDPKDVEARARQLRSLVATLAADGWEPLPIGIGFQHTNWCFKRQLSADAGDSVTEQADDEVTRSATPRPAQQEQRGSKTFDDIRLENHRRLFGPGSGSR